MSNYYLDPKPLKNGHWYANKNSIDVIVHAPASIVRIPRKVLEDYIKRTRRDAKAEGARG